jgi:N-methylhydantoinase B
MNPVTLDPTTFEIVWHHLLSIAEEMGIIYMRCSGSQVLITGNDAATAITLPDGSLVAMGPYITTQGNVLPLIIQSTQRLCAGNPGIADGDMFVCNDPYLGAIHHPDVATVSPVCVDGEVLAWVGASGHQLDTGGMDPGGFSIRAVDTYQEGLRIPPVKLVERGTLREDLLRWILNQVRDPLVGLDVKAQIAANTAGRERLRELARRYSPETVRAAMGEAIVFTRERLRARLRTLPDGTWREVQYIDHDGHTPAIYPVVCTLSKAGDRLALDFTGTAAQARGLINCTYAGLQAGALTAFYICLCRDMPWNRGVLDCLDLVAPEGTVVNCSPPAPCAMATISAVIVVIDCVFRAVSKMLLASRVERGEAMALWTGSSMAPIVSGISQHGFPFVSTEMSHFAGGGGACIDRDGVDTGGIVFNTTPNIANIELIEQDYPVLYLFRKHLADSGGPGKFRGGVSGELAYIVHDAPQGELEASFTGTGAEMPNAAGLSGGLPGAAICILRVLDTDILSTLRRGARLPASLEEVRGRVEVLPPKHPRTPFAAGDVWYHHWQGAGGYGDPLDREPARVAGDVARGLVSRECAERIYGVILNRQDMNRHDAKIAKGGDGEVDEAATARRREDLRAARRRGTTGPASPPPAARPAAGDGGWPVTEYVELAPAAGLLRCRRCGTALAKAGEDYRDGCLRRLDPLTAAGPHRGEAYDRGRFHLAVYLCPGCATLLDADVVLDGAPPVRAIIARLPEG